MNTPNLAALMAQATPGPWNGYIGQDGAFEITGIPHDAKPSLAVLCQRTPWPHMADMSRANGKLIQLLGTHGHAMVAALKKRCDAIEMQAADLSYKCGLGAGEWEAFIDRVPGYEEWKELTSLLTSLDQGAKT